MGYRIELFTGATDKQDAARLLAERVEDGHIILPSDTPVPVGEWVAFEIKLDDGEVVLEGMGRCEGAEPDDDEFEVMLGMLQLDAMNELMLERIELERGDSPPTGEVDVSEVRAGSLDSEPAVLRTEGRPSEAPPAAAPIRPEPPPAARIVSPPSPTVPPRMGMPARVPPPGLPSSPSSPSSPSWRPPPAIARSSVRPSDPNATQANVAAPPPRVRHSSGTLSGSPAPPPNGVSAEHRERLERLLPALRRVGAARQVEDAYELAISVGLNALETILDSKS